MHALAAWLCCTGAHIFDNSTEPLVYPRYLGQQHLETPGTASQPHAHPFVLGKVHAWLTWRKLRGGTQRLAPKHCMEAGACNTVLGLFACVATRRRQLAVCSTVELVL